MKILQGTKKILNLLILGAVALSFAIIPELALAGADLDGFSTQEENVIGVYLPASMKPAWSEAITRDYYDCPDPRFTCAADTDGPETRYYFPNCDDASYPGMSRVECVTDDSGSANIPSLDAFIIFVRGEGCPAEADIACGEPCPEPLFDTNGDGIKNSNYPKYAEYGTYFDPFNAAKSSLDDGGLFISLKELEWVTPPASVVKEDLKIGQTQYAILFTEIMNPCLSAFGSSVPGNPTDPYSGFPQVGTTYIRNWIWDHCTKVEITDRKGNTSSHVVDQCIDSLSTDTVTINLPADPLADPTVTRNLLKDLDYIVISNSSSHELAHAWESATGRGTTFFHYKIGQGNILDQFLYVQITVSKSTNKAKTEIDVSEEHGGQTQDNLQMK
jgi:hypothetical protein